MFNTALKYKIFALLSVVGFLVSCSDIPLMGKLESPEENKKLIVYTRNAATTYYQDNHGDDVGFEYELLKAFTKDQGWELELKVVDSIEQILEAILLKKAHLGAAGLTITKERKKLFEFSPAYMEIQQKVVCSQKRILKSPRLLKEHKFLLTPETSQLERMQALNKEYGPFDIQTEDLSSELILEKVQDSKDLCTVVDSNILKHHRHLYHQLHVIYTFPGKDELAWALHPDMKNLKQDLLDWFSVRGKKRSAQLEAKYNQHLHSYDPFDTKVFLQAIEEKLPQYKALFKKYSAKYDYDWRLVAAISYQESHWDPTAKSPTGVQGIMMLTNRTAKELGVKDRLDAEQSIQGGVRYLKNMQNKVPKYVRPADKIWFALAAYNIGFYHLRDAMALTVLENLDPRYWSNVRSVFPKLTQAKYHSKTRFGYARGREPVLYTARIRNYYKILKAQL